MKITNYSFLYNGQIFIADFKANSIKFGSILYVTTSEAKEITAISNKKGNRSIPTGVIWISGNNAELSDGVIIKEAEIVRIQDKIGPYIKDEILLEKISILHRKLRLDQLYKSKEVENSKIKVIIAVIERLELIEIFAERELNVRLLGFYQSLVVYHLLTCFDLLGQPDNWIDFMNWHISTNKISEKKDARSRFNFWDNFETKVKKYYDFYIYKYGVRKSFVRFINEVIPDSTREELFNSIRISVNGMPNPSIRIKEDSNQTVKMNFLSDLRNKYTHSAIFIPGFHQDFRMPGTKSLFTNFTETINATSWVTISVRDWPDALKKVVKIGLAQYIMNIAE